MRRLAIVWIAFLQLATVGLPAQVVSVDRSTTPPTALVIPGSQYEAGWFHRAFLGDHYRSIWTRPVRVPLLDLDGFAGGVTPLCRGGRIQTKTLRLQGADGREYVFRSVDKDPTAKLPVILRTTFVADVLQDQISSHHPASAAVVEPLLHASGVLHADPFLVVMPDDPRLGLFRDEFAGIAGFIEERPRDGPEGTPGFGGSLDIESTEDVWQLVEASLEHRVDAGAFLRARLMDVFVGDWDRHYDQWRWARYPVADGFTWRPIPRDRDQALSRLDGLLLDLARYYIPELVSFNDSYPNLFGLTWTGRAMDRRFLSGLSKGAWDSVAVDLQERLTDSVIDAAVGAMPPEIQAINGEVLHRALRARRETLPEAADAFYRLLARRVDIHATDENERVDIRRVDDETVRVRVYADTADGDGPAAGVAPHFDRTFHRDETEEIRMYLHGGDDRALVRGNVDRSIVVRVIGGGGDDTLLDSGFVALGPRTQFYDARGSNRFERGLMTSIDRSRFRPPPRRRDDPPPRLPGACGEDEPELPPSDLALPFRDWGSTWLPAPTLSFEPDLGLLVGFGGSRVGYGFRQVPYQSHQALAATLATGPRRPRIEYVGQFPGALRRAGVHFRFRYSGIDIVRFYGRGNETTIDRPSAAYQVTLRQFAVEPSITVGRTAKARVQLGPRLSYAHALEGSGGLIDSLRPYGTGRILQLGARLAVTVDTRDIVAAATRGVHLQAEIHAAPDWLDLTDRWGSVSGTLATYLTATRLPTQPTLALRVSGKKVWGEHPFYDGALLGGGDDLRGFSPQRFAGDASVAGNAELRLFLTRYRFLLPGEFGVFGLADGGRVFLDGESSDTWHAAVGGGIWFAYVERSATVSLAFASSKERRAVYFRTGFMY